MALKYYRSTIYYLTIRIYHINFPFIRYILIGVNLPADGNLHSYNDCIDELETIYSYYSTVGRVVIISAGVLKARVNEHVFSYIQSEKSEILTNFINENIVTPINQTSLCNGPNYTFEPQKSTLDYILVPTAFVDHVKECIIIDNDKCCIASDHLPIFASINILSERFYTPPAEPTPSWHKATDEQLSSYKDKTESYLISKQFKTPETPDEIENLNKLLTNTLINTAKETIPLKKYNPHTKPYWNKELSDAHAKARLKRYLWLNENRPRGLAYDSYREYKTAKQVFRQKQADAIKLYEENVYKDLDEAAELDIRLFWKLLSKHKNRKTNSQKSYTCT